MAPRNVRIADVAREAGVSATAVSFAFNNPERLNAQTVERILAVAHHLGYAPNPHARALLTKSVGVLGVLVPQSIPSIFANPFFSALYEGIGQVCEDNGLSLLTISPVSGSLAKAVANAPVDGFIVVGLSENHEDIDILHRRRVPFVIIDGDASIAPSVNVDDEHGAWQAADFLLRQGHRDILCLTFEIDYTGEQSKIWGVGKRRLDGYKKAFEEYDVAWHDEWLVPTATSMTAGSESFRVAWKMRTSMGSRPTAVLAVSDAIAIGALQAIRDVGLRVPEDIAVIGFDDIPLAAWTRPTLTTVRQPIVEKGETAAQLLLNLIASEAVPTPQVKLSTELVLRQSTSAGNRVA